VYLTGVKKKNVLNCPGNTINRYKSLWHTLALRRQQCWVW